MGKSKPNATLASPSRSQYSALGSDADQTADSLSFEFFFYFILDVFFEEQ